MGLSQTRHTNGGHSLQGEPRGGVAAPDRLEREMVRRSVDSLAAERTICADCGRTPLVGEQLHSFAAGATVCELCRPLRREAPVSTQNVRHSEYGYAVRVTRSS